MEKRITISLYIVSLFFCIFIFRLFSLQVLKGHEYKKIDELNRIRVVDILAPRGIIYDRHNRALVKNVPSFDITAIKEDVPDDSNKLSSMSKLIGLKTDVLKSRLGGSAASPFENIILKQNVSFKEVAKVEARKADFPGLQVNVVGGREYLYGHSASHLLGYLGSLGHRQSEQLQYKGVPKGSFIGLFGIEKIHDMTLRGLAGKKILEVDALGRIINVVRIQRPVQGQDIQLTIDVELQIEAEKNLSGKAGSIVAMDPETGAILAIASSPTFNPNLFVRGIDTRDWKKLIKDSRKPLLNRAIQSQYAPGSTFKIITAIAALEEGIVDRNTNFYCSGSTMFGRVFKCWKKDGHGSVDIHRAIVESCDVYFYEIGKKLDVDVLADYAFGYGLGRFTGLRLDGEVAGIVPTRRWKQETKGERWYKGETLNTVIGQGYLSVTSLQVATMMSAVVNGGKLYEPYLLTDSGNRVRDDSMRKIRPDHIQLIKDALHGVVEEEKGTGRLAMSELVSIAGKTGTTQVVGGGSEEKDIPEKFRDHAWFVAFAPVDNPKIVVSVFIEHGGHGSSAAAPIARNIIDTFYKGRVKL
ncbi:MAG: penicillin-binding protein 2 [Nitrospiraceae bacterium]|nr:MAG: penicillin-binding protein 2 [Nitrospiraceae bacterium]